jgi:hypothetical protein
MVNNYCKGKTRVGNICKKKVKKNTIFCNLHEKEIYKDIIIKKILPKEILEIILYYVYNISIYKIFNELLPYGRKNKNIDYINMFRKKYNIVFFHDCLNFKSYEYSICFGFSNACLRLLLNNVNNKYNIFKKYGNYLYIYHFMNNKDYTSKYEIYNINNITCKDIIDINRYILNNPERNYNKEFYINGIKFKIKSSI